MTETNNTDASQETWHGKPWEYDQLANIVADNDAEELLDDQVALDGLVAARRNNWRRRAEEQHTSAAGLAAPGEFIKGTGLVQGLGHLTGIDLPTSTEPWSAELEALFNPAVHGPDWGVELYDQAPEWKGNTDRAGGSHGCGTQNNGAAVLLVDQGALDRLLHLRRAVQGLDMAKFRTGVGAWWEKVRAEVVEP
jgi:hypothetical protein